MKNDDWWIPFLIGCLAISAFIRGHANKIRMDELETRIAACEASLK